MSDEFKLFQLLHFLACSFERQSDQILLEKFGIGFSQYKILWAMQVNPGVGQRDLAASLAQTEASVSRQIKLLRNLGIIESRKNPKNRRQHLTLVTAKGLRLREVAAEALDELSVDVLSDFDSKSKNNFRELLEATRLSFQKP